MSPTTSTAASAPTSGPRPRVEGDREREILEATLDVLAEVGYDRLTMDAVAGAAHASKATLYRRWSRKSDLVVEALCHEKPEPHSADHALPDTGTLRGDLLAVFCGMDGLTDKRTIRVLASVITAVACDEEFAEAFRSQFIEPKTRLTREIYHRARDRGEIGPDVDVDLIGAALPGIVLHRAFMLGQPPTRASVTRIVDQIILPAVGVGQPSPSSKD